MFLYSLLAAGALTTAPLPLSQAVPAAPVQPAATQPVPQPERSRMLNADELTQTRGGQTILVNNQTLAAILSGNSLGDFQAGDVTLADNALSNFSGLGNFVINTGAQNNLQAGMSVTINVRD